MQRRVTGTIVEARTSAPLAGMRLRFGTALQRQAPTIDRAMRLERRSANGLNGWVSYAWNKYELEDARGAGQPPERFFGDYDKRHTLNAYVAYRWSGRTGLSARMRYGSNFPIRGYVGSAAAGHVLAAERNTLRLPAYARLDLRADRTFTYRKSRLTLFMELVNATNRENFRPSSPGVNVVTRVVCSSPPKRRFRSFQ